MEPVEVGVKNSEYRILNRCQKCGFGRWAPLLPNDDYAVALAIAKKRGDTLQ